VALNPPPVIEANTLIVSQPITFAGSTHVAVVTFGLGRDITMPTDQTMIDAFQTAFNTEIMPNVDSDATAQPPVAKVGQGSTVPLVVTGSGGPQVGGNAITSLPPQVCALIKKTTGTGGKQGRGRMYLPYCLAQANVDQFGNITGGTTRADLTESFDDFLADLVTAHAVPILIHRVKNGAGAVTAINQGPQITKMACELTVGTQRRRLVRQ
jgi:hypothetical protein